MAVLKLKDLKKNVEIGLQNQSKLNTPTKESLDARTEKLRQKRIMELEQERIDEMKSRPLTSLGYGLLDSLTLGSGVGDTALSVINNLTQIATGGREFKSAEDLKKIGEDLYLKNPVAGTVGNILGYVVPGSLAIKGVRAGGMALKTLGKKVAPDVTKKTASALSKSRAKQFAAEEFFVGAGLGGAEALLQGEDGGEALKRALKYGTYGALLGGGIGKLTDKFKGVRTPKGKLPDFELSRLGVPGQRFKQRIPVSRRLPAYEPPSPFKPAQLKLTTKSRPMKALPESQISQGTLDLPQQKFIPKSLRTATKPTQSLRQTLEQPIKTNKSFKPTEPLPSRIDDMSFNNLDNVTPNNLIRKSFTDSLEEFDNIDTFKKELSKRSFKINPADMDEIKAILKEDLQFPVKSKWQVDKFNRVFNGDIQVGTIIPKSAKSVARTVPKIPTDKEVIQFLNQNRDKMTRLEREKLDEIIKTTSKRPSKNVTQTTSNARDVLPDNVKARTSLNPVDLKVLQRQSQKPITSKLSPSVINSIQKVAKTKSPKQQQYVKDLLAGKKVSRKTFNETTTKPTSNNRPPEVDPKFKKEEVGITTNRNKPPSVPEKFKVERIGPITKSNLVRTKEVVPEVKISVDEAVTKGNVSNQVTTNTSNIINNQRKLAALEARQLANKRKFRLSCNLGG